MFQTIDGVDCFVVDITGDPKDFLPVNDGGSPELAPYAFALDTAIRQGIVPGPGKYAINITDSGKKWNVFRVTE